MADFYTKDELKAVYNSLPDALRDAIFSPETSAALNAVQKTHELNQSQREALSSCSGLVLMGILPPELFVKTLVDQLEIKRDKAALIAQTVNRDLFNPVKEYLELIHGVEETKKSEAPTTTPVRVVPPQPPVAPKPIMTARPPSMQKTAVVSTPVTPMSPGPIRSDWGWHGKKNEVTGQIEFKREDVGTKNAYPSQDTSAGTPHVGSVFEQKLAGAFGMKNNDVPQNALPTPPPVQTTTTSPFAGLHVPHKPTEVKIPPAEATQPPRN